MTDQALRDLERRWKQTGSAEDQSVYLRHRLRTGTLTEARLGLAAALGWEAARLTIGTAEEQERELGQLAYCAVVHAGDRRREVAVRFLVACSAFHPQQDTSPPADLRERAAVMLALRDVVERWVVSPNSQSRRRVIKAQARLDRLTKRHNDVLAVFSPDPQAARRERWLTLQSLSLATGVNRRAAHAITTRADDELATHAAAGAREAARDQPGWSSTGAEFEELRLAVCNELGTWALGYADPVAERVAAREGGS